MYQIANFLSDKARVYRVGKKVEELIRTKGSEVVSEFEELFEDPEDRKVAYVSYGFIMGVVLVEIEVKRALEQEVLTNILSKEKLPEA